MKTIRCPKDIGLVNTFDAEDCKREQFYNGCCHCWASAIADCENKNRPQGEWVEVETSEHGGLSIVSMRCDLCERYAYLVMPKGTKCVYNFCPWCQADMRGDKR